MQQPSRLELLIVPYLAGELSPAEQAEVERAVAEDADYARLVQEFRETLALVGGGEVFGEAHGLAGLEETIYRQVVARQTREAMAGKQGWAPRVVGAGLAVLQRAWWRPLAVTSAAALATVVVGVYFAGRSVLPAAFAPVAALRPPLRAVASDAAGVPKTEAIHAHFLREEREQTLDEARLAHHARGDVSAALAGYEAVLEGGHDSWTWRVAQTERSALLETVRPLLPDTRSVFLEVSQR
jgi:hypothetical protein